MANDEVKQVEEIWVNTAEGAQVTGYDPDSLRKLASNMAKKPEEERTIKVRRRTSGWEMWLPDLVHYVKQPRPGPILKSKKSDSPIP
jgi:hypothetical protein